MRRLGYVFLVLLATSGTVLAKTKGVQWLPEAMVWKDSPPPVPAGFQAAVLEGDPKKPGIYTVRAKFPPAGKLAPHFHPGAERVTVLQGSVMVGFGDVADLSKATRFPVGSFYVIPAGVHHFSQAGPEGAIIQITGQGPWSTHFLGEKKK